VGFETVGEQAGNGGGGHLGGVSVLCGRVADTPSWPGCYTSWGFAWTRAGSARARKGPAVRFSATVMRDLASGGC
jgi:hypothetical protein